MPQLDSERYLPFGALIYTSLGLVVVSLFFLALGIGATIFAPYCLGESCGLLSPDLIFPIVLLIILAVLAQPVLWHFLFTYKISAESITINTGILLRQYETIHFGRIQTIDNERNLIHMLFGITEMKIWTASADQTDISLSDKEFHSHPHADTSLLLASKDAESLKDFIMNGKRTTAAHPGL